MSTLASKPWLSSYAEGVPSEIPPVTQTLVDMMWDVTRTYRFRTALEFFGATLTYGDVREQIARVANGLRKLGVSKGDRVAIVLPNCPEHVIAFYAVLRLGAVVVEHNPLYTERELRHQFEDHGAKVAIVWNKVAPTLLGFAGDLQLTSVVHVDITRSMGLSTRVALSLPVPKARAARDALTTTADLRGGVEWKQLAGSRFLPNGHPRPALSDIAVLQYTSGTTGTPKGAILTHHNLRANAMQGEAWVPGLSKGEEVFYGVLPMFHAYGLTLCLTFAMSIGARLVLFPKFDEKLVLDAMRKSPATFIPAVPPIYERLAKAAAARRVDLSSIKFAISGAMSLPVSIVEQWETATGGYLVEGYGMTESSPVAVGNPIGPSRRPGAVGVPFPSTDIRIVDPADVTVDLDVDQEGELLIKGPQVFQGYWNRPTETSETLTSDGWLRTGDIATVSADGFVTIVDRMKELIITGGFNVAPSEVEAALLSHPSVADAAVVGLPSNQGGEDVAAVVVLAPGASLDVADLRAHAKSRLSAYKVPKTIVERDELPRSLIGKVLRKQVRDELKASRA